MEMFKKCSLSLRGAQNIWIFEIRLGIIALIPVLSLSWGINNVLSGGKKSPWPQQKDYIEEIYRHGQ